MKQKICILGTSPLMALIYFRLRERFDIKIFEKNALIGGAWKYHNYEDISYSTFNNIIIPDNQLEDEKIDKINLELSRYGCSVNKPITLDIPKYPYNAKNIFLHDFSNFYEVLNNSGDIYTSEVDELNIFEDKILVNSEAFAFLFLPSCFKINDFKINNSKMNIIPKSVISTHLTVFFDKKKLSLCTYNDNFDNVFDRAQIKLISNQYIFTGRVRKDFKGKNIDFLCKKSNFLREKINSITFKELNYYEHNIIDSTQLDHIKSNLKGFPVSIVETRQLNNGYLYLNDSIDMIKI